MDLKEFIPVIAHLHFHYFSVDLDGVGTKTPLITTRIYYIWLEVGLSV
jgi:hypothetical protein